MTKFNIFIIRAIIGAVFAVVLMRIFHPEFHVAYVAIFAIILTSLAYALEGWRNKKFKKKE